MEIGFKIIYFVIFIISIVLVISLWLLSLDHWLHPFKKNSEAVILLLGSIIISLGMYLSVKDGYQNGAISKGLLLIFGSWFATILFITIGLVFFNGPTK